MIDTFYVNRRSLAAFSGDDCLGKISSYDNHSTSLSCVLDGRKINLYACSWMDLHTDDPVGSETEWEIRVLYQCRDSAFVYTDDEGKFRMVHRFVLGQVYKFNFLREHGFMPLAIAERLVDTNSSDFTDYEFFERQAMCEKRTNPRLIWEFQGVTP